MATFELCEWMDLMPDLCRALVDAKGAVWDYRGELAGAPCHHCAEEAALCAGGILMIPGHPEHRWLSGEGTLLCYDHLLNRAPVPLSFYPKEGAPEGGG